MKCLTMNCVFDLYKMVGYHQDIFEQWIFTILHDQNLTTLQI